VTNDAAGLDRKFAALILTVMLKGGLGVWRFVSAAMITRGIVLNRDKP